jgi:hypothetical protein
VFAHTSLVLAPGRHGLYMMGSDAPIGFDDATVREVVGNPGTRADLAEMPDHPAGISDAEGWVRAVHEAAWLQDAEVDELVGPGPLITDDHPRSEYFFWRRARLDDRSYISESMLRAATPPSAQG